MFVIATDAAGAAAAADLPIPPWIIPVIVGIIILIVIARAGLDQWAEHKNRQGIEEAEKAQNLMDRINEQIEHISKVEADKATKDNLIRTLTSLVDRHADSIDLETLFKLNSRQLNQYQQQTRSRASWSFIFAIIAMLAGLGFVFWGGAILFRQAQWQQVISGSALSAIGGGVSAYITATFLTVHKGALLQLNHYFRQPVLRGYALMAIHFADSVKDDDLRKKSYEKIIDQLIGLIREVETKEPVNVDSDDTEKVNE